MNLLNKKGIIIVGTLVVLAMLAVAVASYYGLFSFWPNPGKTEVSSKESSVSAAAGSSPAPSLQLSDSQLASIKIAPVGHDSFSVEKEAVGSIDFDEDLCVQVFTPYQGKIIAAFAQLGDVVQKGQPLYTIDSPDLVQAESTLIGAAATLDLTNKELERARALYETNKAVAQRELEQAISDQQTAEGALKAARDAVRVFGKTEDEIDQMVKIRKIDPALVVVSPIAGQITARNAQPGLLVQPGNPPAPYSVADVSTKWMLANITETDSPLIQVGQPVEVAVLAYPGRVFKGKISKLGAVVDPNTHRVMARYEIADPKDELRPGMLASFVIRVQAPVESVAIPVNGVVRNGDGTMAAWVTTDRHHFLQRIIKVGLQRDGEYQVLEGLQAGEVAVTDGAIFLNYMLEAPPSD
jgi:cobalt-zinc-cadmium efflux system membrane fusion protein